MLRFQHASRLSVFLPFSITVILIMEYWLNKQITKLYPLKKISFHIFLVFLMLQLVIQYVQLFHHIQQQCNKEDFYNHMSLNLY